jgi:RNA-directed DNA polymerase
VYLPGWKAYFRLAQTPKTFGELKSWIVRRLRAIQLKLLKRATMMYRGLRASGATTEVAAKIAAGGRHRWRASGSRLLHLVLTVDYFASLGAPKIT